MYYVMSDLHGCYKEYKKMLEMIHFSENDILFVLGDICDRGNDGISILFDMMRHDNIYPILGNHDYLAAILLRKGWEIDQTKDVDKINEELILQFRAWMIDGGKPTIEAFQNLSDEQKEMVLEYFEEFSLYEEIVVNDCSFIMVHAGFSHYEKGKKLDDYSLNDLIFEGNDLNQIYYEDHIVIVGHTPTVMIDKNYAGKIYHQNNGYWIDCGCVFGYSLGCLCLDTMETFYVKKQSES